jgi:6-phosphofructokinase 1
VSSITRIGILTGGGDAPGTNAVIRALTRSLTRSVRRPVSGRAAVEVLGIEDGYLGLIERRVLLLDRRAVAGTIAQGGTLLGSSSRASPLNHEGSDRRDQVLAYARELGLDGVVAIGGDGTLAIADAMHRFGLPTIGVPKTIDNDILGVERSFGFDTAVSRAAEALDDIQTTAQSMRRVMLVETMGRHAGWIALEAGLAAGADVILLPEIEFDLQAVAAVCRERESRQRFTVVCVAEGTKPAGGAEVLRGWVAGAPDPARLGGVAEVLVQQLQPLLKSEVRAVVLGHVQRGGLPTASDRVLSTLYGSSAADLVLEGAWGQMVTYARGSIGRRPLADAARGQRRVPADHPLLHAARQIGVSLG